MVAMVLKFFISFAFLFFAGLPLSLFGWLMVMWFIMQEGVHKPGPLVSIIAIVGYLTAVVFINGLIIRKIFLYKRGAYARDK